MRVLCYAAFCQQASLLYWGLVEAPTSLQASIQEGREGPGAEMLPSRTLPQAAAPAASPMPPRIRKSMPRLAPRVRVSAVRSVSTCKRTRPTAGVATTNALRMKSAQWAFASSTALRTSRTAKGVVFASTTTPRTVARAAMPACPEKPVSTAPVHCPVRKGRLPVPGHA